jgi:hypothetical protein
LVELLSDGQAIAALIDDSSAEELNALLRQADLTAATLRSGFVRDKAVLLPTLVDHIALQEESISLFLDRAKLAAVLGASAEVVIEGEALVLSTPAVRVRKGHQLRLVIPGPQTIRVDAAKRDGKLIALLAEAHHARQLVLDSPGKSLVAIAAANGRCRTRLGKLAALACLAPDIVTAIVEGRKPSTLTAPSLLDIELPISWAEQRKLLGFS